MKTLVAIGCLLLSGAGVGAVAQADSRQRINFDDNWRFHLGHAADPVLDYSFRLANIFSKTGKAVQTAIDPAFDDSCWRTVQLPHDWAVELPFVNSADPDVMAHGYKPIGGLFPASSVGWYRKHFRIDKADSGLRFQLQFDGIFRDAVIWLNGFYLGNNKSGYLGIEYDISDYINYDSNNTVVVRADATQAEGWFYEGAGIYRHAWLNRSSNTAIVHDGVFAYTEIADNTAVVTIETTIENRGIIAAPCTISVSLTDRDGRKLTQTAAQPVQLAPGEMKMVRQQLTIDNPMLWSPDTPYLYRVIPTVSAGGKQQDHATVRIGMRTVAVTAKGVYLNGKYLKIKGTNNHQDHGGVGSAIPDALQYYRVRLLKELGANAYRTSHHAPTPELLDACDSLGMLVLDEQRLLNSSPAYMDEFTRLLKRDRSRACVFMWCIGNEEQTVQGNGIGKRLAQSFLTKQQELDPTRTCTYAADLGNIFTGINEVIPVRGFNYRHASATAYHLNHPLQPLIGTEMGSTLSTRGIFAKDSLKGYLPDQDINAPWWASTAEAWWPLAANNEWMLGGFIWTGFDYRGEPTPFQWPEINSQFGVMDICGFPKNIYYYYQSWWTSKDVLHISPHWNWKRQGRTTC